MKFYSFNEIPDGTAEPIEEESKKSSKKELDIFSNELLEDNQEIREKIISILKLFSDANLRMPVMHITSDVIQLADGKKIDTGFIKNIKDLGFRKRDTNVGAFVERNNNKTCLGDPKYFSEHPEEFVKSIKLFIARYIHHGIRINKNILKDLKKQENAEALPSMLIIDGNLELEKGSDYDDHYILKDGATAEKIIGNINLGNHCRSKNKEDILFVVEEFLSNMESYVNKNKL